VGSGGRRRAPEDGRRGSADGGRGSRSRPPAARVPAGGGRGSAGASPCASDGDLPGRAEQVPSAAGAGPGGGSRRIELPAWEPGAAADPARRQRRSTTDPARASGKPRPESGGGIPPDGGGMMSVKAPPGGFVDDGRKHYSATLAATTAARVGRECYRRPRLHHGSTEQSCRLRLPWWVGEVRPDLLLLDAGGWRVNWIRRGEGRGRCPRRRSTWVISPGAR